jgi:hypothetical protein
MKRANGKSIVMKCYPKVFLLFYDAMGDYFIVKPLGFKGDTVKIKDNKMKDNASALKEKSNKMNKKQKNLLEGDEKKYLLFDGDDEENDEQEVDVQGPDIDIETSVSDLNTDDSAPQNNQSSTAPSSTGASVSYEEIARLVDEIVSKHIGGTKNANVEQTIPQKDQLSSSADTPSPATEMQYNAATSDFPEIQDRVEIANNKISNEPSYYEELMGEGGEQDFEVEDAHGGAQSNIGIEKEQDNTFNIQQQPQSQARPKPQTAQSIDDEDEPEVLDEVEELNTGGDDKFVANGTVNCNGKPVKIQISGIVMTESDVKDLSLTCERYKTKLRKLESKQTDELFMFVESNNRIYKIRYEDRPFAATQRPWSINNVKFGTLTEALNRVKNATVPEADTNSERFLKKLVLENKDLANRQITNNYRDADILEESKKGIRIPDWNVKSVGPLSLKTGLNETYSQITKHNPQVKNTLIKNDKGQYLLIKGFLTETKVGDTKNVLDFQNKKNYGFCQIVGVYENSSKGLAQIALKTNKQTLPLFIYR